MNRTLKLFAPDLNKDGELVPEVALPLSEGAPIPDVIMYDNRCYVQGEYTDEYVFAPVLMLVEPDPQDLPDGVIIKLLDSSKYRYGKRNTC